jgi:hypothetical protein
MAEIPLSTGVPETILPAAPEEALGQLRAASARNGPEYKGEVARVAAAFPKCIAAWATLGELTGDDIEAYAYFRVGYHRGLDALRGAGWRGSGYVRWRHETNRPFLRALDGLRAKAEAIGERDEADRCAEFLRQLDPAWPPTDR